MGDTSPRMMGEQKIHREQTPAPSSVMDHQR